MRTTEELHRDMNVWRVNEQPKPDPFSEEEAQIARIAIAKMKDELKKEIIGTHQTIDH